MKTLPSIFLALAVAVPATWFAARGFSGHGFSLGGSRRAESAERKILYYQSPMHPQVRSDKPGQCTICGMDLVPIYAGEHGANPSLDGIVHLTQTQIQVLHVQTAEVKTRPLLKTLTVAGQINDDATRHRVLSAYLDGRIERLQVNFVGAEVTEGQPLAEFYSPALLQAEREYRQLTGDLQKRTGLRLRQMGLSPAQIDALPAKDPDALSSQILSPIGGSVVLQNIYEGQYVKEGEKLFEIADFSTMWFVFQAYEQDLPWIELGQTVDVTTPSRPGQTFSGRITFIDPNFDEAVRATKVRVELPNPLVDGRRALLHRLYADGTVHLEMPASLSVPRSAIIETGTEAVVYVDEGGGAYARRVLKTGRRGDDLVEVLSGAKEGEKVVTNGNLLIDGQSDMNRAFGMPGESPQPTTSPTIPTLTQSQQQAISDFVALADAMSAALATDDLPKFNEVSTSATKTTGALVEVLLDKPNLAEALTGLSTAAHFHEFADLPSARKAFHGFTVAATTALQPIRPAVGTPDFKVFECSMVDQAIPGAEPKGRWLLKPLGGLEPTHFSAAKCRTAPPRSNPETLNLKTNIPMSIPQSIPLAGMTCGNCVAKVQKRLGEHPEIESATVRLQPPRAEVQTRRTLTNEELDAWLAPVGNYRVSSEPAPQSLPAASLPKPTAVTYRPLIILLLYLLTVTASVLIAAGEWDTMLAMRLFMGGFFIAFSFFKMLDLPGFADAYRGYDIVAKAFPPYAFVYPFLEFGLGLAYLAHVAPLAVNVITAAVMLVSLAGVLRAVLSKQAIRCACLGTVFQLPMSTVTIIEDGLMLAMAVTMLVLA